MYLHCRPDVIAESPQCLLLLCYCRVTHVHGCWYTEIFQGKNSQEKLQDLAILILQKQATGMHMPQTWWVYMQLPVAKVLDQVTVSALSSTWWDAPPFDNWKLPGHVCVAGPNTRGAGSLACPDVLHFTWRAPLSAESAFLRMAKELLGAPGDPFSWGLPPHLALLHWAPGFCHACRTADGRGKNHILPRIERWTLGWCFFPKLGFPLPKLPSRFSGSYQFLRLLPLTGSARAF